MTTNQQEIITGVTTVTTPADREIASERVFDAPRDRVFAAYTDPELISQWRAGLVSAFRGRRVRRCGRVSALASG